MTMFSHNLYEALCQSQRIDATLPTAPEEDAAMMQAIERAMEAYQRLFVGQNSAE